MKHSPTQRRNRKTGRLEWIGLPAGCGPAAPVNAPKGKAPRMTLHLSTEWYAAHPLRTATTA